MFGAGLLIAGVIRCQTAPSASSSGGDAGAYAAENDHAAAVYFGGGLGVAGAVLGLIGLARLGRNPR